jgi:hypothetical protein
MKKAAIVLFFVAVINFVVMMIQRHQEMTSSYCLEFGGCGFAGVSQGLSIVFVSFPLFILSGIFAWIAYVRKKRRPEAIEKINKWSIIGWIVGLSIIASMIVPILI